jgi:hypothetical protein
MKFERCLDCGLMFDRDVRGVNCPHCNAFNWLYFIGGTAILVCVGCGVALWALL